MALSTSLIFSFLDAKGQTSTTEINLPSTMTLPNLIVAAQQAALLINPLITGAITRIGIVFSVSLPSGLRTTPLTGSDVEEGARFQMLTTGGNRTSLRLPTFNESKISTSSRAVNQSDADVAAFIAFLEDGINLVPAGGTGTASPTDKRDEDIVAVTSALEQFVSSRA